MGKKKSLSAQWLDAGMGNLLRPPKNVEEKKVIKSSPLLLEFYKWWCNLTPVAGLPPCVTAGLCTNLAMYSGYANLTNGQYDDLSGEMKNQFIAAGLSATLPFNIDLIEYAQESCRDACYRNPARVEWVKDRIADMEK